MKTFRVYEPTACPPHRLTRYVGQVQAKSQHEALCLVRDRRGLAGLRAQLFTSVAVARMVKGAAATKKAVTS